MERPECKGRVGQPREIRRIFEVQELCLPSLSGDSFNDPPCDRGLADQPGSVS